MNSSDWIEFRNYSAQYEADLAIGVLKEAGIPVMTRGPLTGAFGPSFAGPTIHGVTVFVPAEFIDEARDLLLDE